MGLEKGFALDSEVERVREREGAGNLEEGSVVDDDDMIRKRAMGPRLGFVDGVRWKSCVRGRPFE